MSKFDSFQVDPTTKFYFRHGHIYQHTSNPTLIALIQRLRAPATIQATRPSVWSARAQAAS